MSSFEFFILNALRSGSMDGFALARTVGEVTRGFFKTDTEPFERALGSLADAGWVSVDRPEKIYSITSVGEQQLEVEWSRRQWELVQFVEEGGAFTDRFNKVRPGARN